VLGDHHELGGERLDPADEVTHFSGGSSISRRMPFTLPHHPDVVLALDAAGTFSAALTKRRLKRGVFRSVLLRYRHRRRQGLGCSPYAPR
jgi:hypothetical protein